MEQPHGSEDDLQPQDLSNSNTVIDMTKRDNLNATSLDVPQVVKSPGCYTNIRTSNSCFPSSETSSSDVTLQSGDQTQPNNAFSHTTVTLSYVSRSHIYSTHDSLSPHSPLYGVPPISKFSLHSACEAEKGHGETGYAPNQQYLENVDRPTDLAVHTELFNSLSQVVPVNDGLCLMHQPHQANGGVLSSDGDMEHALQGGEENSLSQETETSGGLQNGEGDSWSSSGVCPESSPETLTPVTGKEDGREVSEVLFLTSKKQESVVIPDNVDVRELCSPSTEYKSPLEDPVSPTTTSLDDVGDVFILPQASCSPSGDNSLLETADDIAWDDSSTEGATQLRSGIIDTATRLHSSDENRKPVHRRKAVLEPLIDLTDDVCLSEVSAVKTQTAIPHMNGNGRALQRTLHEKERPVRSGRGIRLEAIVMNINSSGYKLSGCIRTNKNGKASKKTAKESNSACPQRNDTLSDGKRRCRTKASFSVKATKQRTVTPLKGSKTNSIKKDRCKVSTSDSEITNSSKTSHSSKPPKSPKFTVHKRSKTEPEDVSHPGHSPQISPVKSKGTDSSPSSPPLALKEPELLSHPDPSLDTRVARLSPPPPKNSPKKSPGSAKGKATGQKTSPVRTKAAGTPKKRQKKPQQRQFPSMFAPKEPEIKLRYVNYKEEKRDFRHESFSPFVHVERQQSSPSLCTVVNYPEEVRTQHKSGQQQKSLSGCFISTAVPSTSCLRLGRVSVHSQHERSLVCCLCGLSANAMDLGDLHGPYYPEGYQLSTKTQAGISGLKEGKGDYSDSDSSSCSMKGRGRKSAILPTSRPLRPAAQLKKKGPPQSHQWITDGTGSPEAKRARSEVWPADVGDWYSAPVLPLEPCEYWLHEDCGIWSTGVFLVKGKVYGLEEAVKLAQETVCSACCCPGATLGCFFKSCPNKYHYRCALQSDCVLIEENFSMKCKKHKNKTFKAPVGKQRDDR